MWVLRQGHFVIDQIYNFSKNCFFFLISLPYLVFRKWICNTIRSELKTSFDNLFIYGDYIDNYFQLESKHRYIILSFFTVFQGGCFLIQSHCWSANFACMLQLYLALDTHFVLNTNNIAYTKHLVIQFCLYPTVHPCSSKRAYI